MYQKGNAYWGFFSLSLLFFQFYNKISNRTRCHCDCGDPITNFSPCKDLQDILCWWCHRGNTLQRHETLLFETSLFSLLLKQHCEVSTVSHQSGTRFCLPVSVEVATECRLYRVIPYIRALVVEDTWSCIGTGSLLHFFCTRPSWKEPMENDRSK